MEGLDHGHVVDAIVGAPVGAALLATLELEARADAWWGDWTGDSSPDAVKRAATATSQMTFTQVCKLTLRAASELVPWSQGSDSAHERVALAVNQRQGIAESLVTSFHTQLAEGLDLQGPQELRLRRDTNHDYRRTMLFNDYSKIYGAGSDFGLIYGNGQFTWASLETSTPADHSLERARGYAREMSRGDYDRWLLSIAGQPRVFEICSFEDWLTLINQHGCEQSGGRRGPDWAAIAEHYDAVHLTWLGLLTAHDNSAAANENGIITLTYWFDEQTHWLRNCFGQAQIVGQPDEAATLDVVPQLLGLSSDSKER